MVNLAVFLQYCSYSGKFGFVFPVKWLTFFDIWCRNNIILQKNYKKEKKCLPQGHSGSEGTDSLRKESDQKLATL